MLIINADDYGRDWGATDNSLLCYQKKRITSATAMVFMVDSQRSAELSRGLALEIGLHVNLSLPFDGPGLTSRLKAHHQRVARYLLRGAWAQALYNPFIRDDLDYVTKAQFEEYARLFGHEPTHVDGHHHMHLCMNMIMDRLVPRGQRMRRSFSFKPGEKSVMNRAYRWLIDAWLIRHYICSDAFYSLAPWRDPQRLDSIVLLARRKDVELMVHPAENEQFGYLMSEPFGQMISGVSLGCHQQLRRSIRSGKRGQRFSRDQ